MPSTRKHELTFGDMKVSIESWTAQADQSVNLEILGIADMDKVKKTHAEQGAIISTDRLIEPKYRDAVNLIRDEMDKIGKAMGCEKNDYHPSGAVRQGFMVPRMKIMMAAIRPGPEYKKEETKNTKAVFDAMQKRLEEIAPQVKERLARAEEQEQAGGPKPPYLKEILEGPEETRERLKKEITIIAPEISVRNIDPLVSYVEAKINAAASKSQKPPSMN